MATAATRWNSDLIIEFIYLVFASQCAEAFRTEEKEERKKTIIFHMQIHFIEMSTMMTRGIFDGERSLFYFFFFFTSFLSSNFNRSDGFHIRYNYLFAKHFFWISFEREKEFIKLFLSLPHSHSFLLFPLSRSATIWLQPANDRTVQYIFFNLTNCICSLNELAKIYIEIISFFSSLPFCIWETNFVVDKVHKQMKCLFVCQRQLKVSVYIFFFFRSPWTLFSIFFWLQHSQNFFSRSHKEHTKRTHIKRWMWLKATLWKITNNNFSRHNYPYTV